MKGTKRLLFSVLLAFLTLSTSALAGEVDLKVNGVGLGTKYDTVVKKLGKPLKSRKVRITESCAGEPYTEITLTYPGLTVQLSGENNLRTQTVYKIKISSASKLAVSGIKVGATQKEIIGRFGKPNDSSKMRLSYVNKGNDGLAEFKFKDGRLVSVEWEPSIC